MTFIQCPRHRFKKVNSSMRYGGLYFYHRVNFNHFSEILVKSLFVCLDKLGKDYKKNLQKFDDYILLLFQHK